MQRLFILLFSIVVAGEMEVDGDLKVTGTVDANGNPITNVGAALSMTDAINGNVLQSALRDDGEYEYKILCVHINWHNSYGGYLDGFRWLELNQFDNINLGMTGEMENYNNIDTFSTEIGNLLNGGWDIHSINGEKTSWWIFKRPISDD